MLFGALEQEFLNNWKVTVHRLRLARQAFEYNEFKKALTHIDFLMKSSKLQNFVKKHLSLTELSGSPSVLLTLLAILASYGYLVYSFCRAQDNRCLPNSV